MTGPAPFLLEKENCFRKSMKIVLRCPLVFVLHNLVNKVIINRDWIHHKQRKLDQMKWKTIILLPPRRITDQHYVNSWQGNREVGYQKTSNDRKKPIRSKHEAFMKIVWTEFLFFCLLLFVFTRDQLSNNKFNKNFH